MYTISDKDEFGKKLQKLREKRKRENGTAISGEKSGAYSYCETQKKFMKEFYHKYEAFAGSEDRRKLMEWENGKKYPNAAQAAALCNLLGCDFSYLIGDQKYPEKSKQDIAEELDLDYDNIELLIRDRELAEIINYFLKSEQFKGICIQLIKASAYNYIDLDLLSHVKSDLSKLLKVAFAEAFASYSPYYDLPEAFKNALTIKVKDFQTKEILSYLSEDIKNEISYSAQDNNVAPNSPEYRNLIIKTIIDFTIQPLSNQMKKDTDIRKISDMFAQLSEKYIKDMRLKIKANINRVY